MKINPDEISVTNVIIFHIKIIINDFEDFIPLVILLIRCVGISTKRNGNILKVHLRAIRLDLC